jgi:bifunctional DNA-binding transcriptional regulator/antitoxin component of YhaV-PrlF toxin-antitoxin module
MMPQTVKAREHHGADSLDLTIPTEIVREYNLSPGDVLEVSTKEGQDGLKICYEVVHKTQSG